jgi:glycosyltransferase involved in cell wall biosynthesis
LIRREGYQVIEFNISGKHPFIKAGAKFRRIIHNEKPDIIHSWLYDANISARLALFRNSKIPLITSLQSPDYEPEVVRIGNLNPNKIRILKAIDKVTVSMSKPYFVACSEFVKNSYQQHLGIDKAKTQVIYNSVDPKGLDASEDDLKKLRDELSLPADSFIFLHVGRLNPEKNHKILLEAFQQLFLEAPNAFLLLVGVGRLENELKKLAQDLGIGEKVLFLGRRSDIGALLELADVFVFPSSFEGLGVALVEAMFKSLPSIVSRIEVLKEVVTNQETGLLFNHNSSSELKEAMISLYRNGELRKSIGENAFYLAKEKFNVTKTGRQWEQFYQRVISEK